MGRGLPGPNGPICCVLCPPPGTLAHPTPSALSWAVEKDWCLQSFLPLGRC